MFDTNMNSSQDDGSSAGGSPRLDGRVQKHIGENLKRLHDEIVDEPVPDEIMALLSKLGEAQNKK